MPYREHLPPDVTACIFWLKKRRRDDWRDKHDHEHTGKGGGPIETKRYTDIEAVRLIGRLLTKAKAQAATGAAGATDENGLTDMCAQPGGFPS